MLLILLADPFMAFRRGFGRFLMALFAVALLISLVAVVVCIINGDRDSMRKFLRWAVLAAAGLALFGIFSNLSL